MLGTIRSMIKEKTDLLEAASIIFEDGSGTNLDDVIVLGEDTDIPEDDHVEDDDKNPDEPETGDANDTKEDNDTSDDISDIPIEDEPVNEPEPTPIEPDNSLLDVDISDEGDTPLPGEDLPEPIGRQTGEPINPIDDFLNVEIDLGSNTQKDVLPIPPSNAGDVVEGDSDTQHVDSGFENEDGDNTPSEPIGNGGEVSSPLVTEKNLDLIESFFNSVGGYASQYKEAITIGDDAGEEKPADGNEAPVEDAPAGEDPVGEENDVTAAVKDKVAEAEADAPETDTKTSKDELLKKLGNITKSLEDAKKAVMSSIQ